MTAMLSRQGLWFLYRTDQGAVDRRTWWLGAILLAAILLVLSLGWLALAPWASRGLDERAFLDPLTIAAYVYLAAFSFATILIAVSYVNLSAKRFRARGHAGSFPLALAGAPLIVLLLAGAAHWLQGQAPGSVSVWLVVGLDTLALAALIWHVIDLGVRADRTVT